MGTSNSTKKLQLRVILFNSGRLATDSITAELDTMGDVAIIGEPTDCAEVFRLCEKRLPDALIYVTDWRDGQTLTTIHRIIEEFPALSIVVLNMSPPVLQIAAVFAAGAHGYVNIDSLADLSHVLRLAINKGFGHCSSSLRELLALTVNGRTLTPREELIAAQIAAGRTTAEIASALTLKQTTIATHIERILRKIGGRTRVDIATWWLWRLGLPGADLAQGLPVGELVG